MRFYMILFFLQEIKNTILIIKVCYKVCYFFAQKIVRLPIKASGTFLFHHILRLADDFLDPGFQGFYFLNLCFIQGLVVCFYFFYQLRHIQVILCDPAGGYAAAAPSVMQRLSRPHIPHF